MRPLILWTLLFGILRFSSSCSHSSYVGTFYQEYKSIELKNDSSFNYLYADGGHEKRALGTWKVNTDGNIILHSSYDYQNIPIKVLEETNGNERYVFKIVIKTSMDKSLQDTLQYSILIADDEYPILPGKDNRITQQGVKSFKIKIHYPVEDNLPMILHNDIFSELYQIHDVSANSFFIDLPVEFYMFQLEQMNTDTLKYRNDKIYWESISSSPFRRSRAN